jgi:hypothetical protein
MILGILIHIGEGYRPLSSYLRTDFNPGWCNVGDFGVAGMFRLGPLLMARGRRRLVISFAFKRLRDEFRQSHVLQRAGNSPYIFNWRSGMKTVITARERLCISKRLLMVTSRRGSYWSQRLRTRRVVEASGRLWWRLH